MARLLLCDPSTITFSTSGVPNFTSPETEAHVKLAAEYLKEMQGPVAFPSETVYGLGASAMASEAVTEIFSVKGRPPDNPLIVHVSSLDMLNQILPPGCVLPPAYEPLMKHFWPGPLSLLFPVNRSVIPSIVTANHPTVAVRMPSHPVARALIALSNCPLAAPSANTSGKPSPTKADHVKRDLGNRIGLILDGGPSDVGVESTVVDGLGPNGDLRVLRPGGVTVEAIRKCLNESGAMHTINVPVKVHRRDYEDIEIEAAPTTPGMKYRHYSPSVPVFLLMTSPPPVGQHAISLSNVVNTFRASKDIKRLELTIGLMTTDDGGVTSPPNIPAITWERYSLGPTNDLSIMARRLFDGLLALESRKVDCIMVEGVSEDGEGLAIMNRMYKAANEVRWIL